MESMNTCWGNLGPVAEHTEVSRHLVEGRSLVMALEMTDYKCSIGLRSGVDRSDWPLDPLCMYLVMKQLTLDSASCVVEHFVFNENKCSYYPLQSQTTNTVDAYAPPYYDREFAPVHITKRPWFMDLHRITPVSENTIIDQWPKTCQFRILVLQ